MYSGICFVLICFDLTLFLLLGTSIIAQDMSGVNYHVRNLDLYDLLFLLIFLLPSFSSPSTKAVYLLQQLFFVTCRFVSTLREAANCSIRQARLLATLES